MNTDQERVENLLKETVILLCKNGLKFTTNVKVQGLLGITLDNADIFLVQIDERICKPVNIDLLKKEDDYNTSTRTHFQTTHCFEPTKQKAGKNQDWIFDEQNVLVSTVAEVENVNNEVRFQDTEVCNIFRNGVSHLGEQSVRISCSSSGSICDIKSENHEEQQMDSVRVKQQNIATQSIAPLAAKCNSGNPMNKSTRLLYNRSLACSRSRKSRRQVQKERTDKFYPPLIEINPALQATVSKKVSKEVSRLYIK